MKIFTGALVHETSSFSPIPTSAKNFRQRRPGVHASTQDLLAIGDTGAVGRWIQMAAERGHDIVLGASASAGPSGLTVQADYEAMRDALLEDLAAALPVDMVVLFLHGSQMAFGYVDCEGDVLTRVRALVGPDVPIGVELDLHCNVTSAMVENATVIMACKEYPHTDFGDRAVDLFNLIERAAKGEIRPVTSFRRIPMLNLFFTTRAPMRQFVDFTAALEGEGGILSISLNHGFTSADTKEAMASVIVVTDDDGSRGDEFAEALARTFFALREIAGPKTLGIDAALDAALAAPPGKPVVLADGSDNPGGGSAGDSTFILQRILERGIEGAAVAMIWDPMAVHIAADAGPGAKLPLRIGGKVSKMSGEPLDVMAEVLAVAEAPMQQSFSEALDTGLGPSVAIRVGGCDIVLNSRRVQTFSPHVFTELGIDPTQKRLLVVKSNQHFYARFAPMAETVLYADAPGTTSNHVAGRPYRNLSRPIWPLDPVSL